MRSRLRSPEADSRVASASAVAQKVLFAVVVVMAAASGVILGLDLFAFTEQ